MPLGTVRKIQEERGLFHNAEFIDLHNDLIDESSDCSNTDYDNEEEDFSSDEVAENSHDVDDEHALTEESSISLTQS